MRDIRGLALPALVETLRKRLDEQGCDFNGTSDGRRSGFEGFYLNQWSKRYIKVLLARMTAHVERESGIDSSAAKYLVEGRGRYEIEHIWAAHYARHREEFDSEAEFWEHRDRFGDLLLLPKSFNASYGDLTYAKKRKHYLSQNLLAWSLHEQCYERNPGFLAYIEREDLPFKPLEEFRRADIDARHGLYRQLAERIWSPALLDREVSAVAAEAAGA